MRIGELVLTELFDKPYPVKIFSDQAVAKDSEGKPIYVVFDRYPAWETVKVTFDRGGDFSLTDYRDEFKIFSTVVEAIKQWVNKYQPGSLYFSVPEDEPTNRIRLYQRMVDRLAATTGYTYTSNPHDIYDDSISYYMARTGKTFYSDKFWWLVHDSLIKSKTNQQV